MAECKALYQGAIPEIYVTLLALHKMRYYIDNTDKEIGWLGYVSRLDKNVYLIEDVFLVKQKVHSATTEIDPEALASLATNLIKQGEQGISLYNKIRLWGHSHVNMDTFASGQDDAQMDEFDTSDFYIRLIGNKNGSWNVCLYDYNSNVVWSGLELKMYYEVEINNEELDKEIKDNVSVIEYKYKGFDTGRNALSNMRNYFDYYGDDYYGDDYYGRYSSKGQADTLREEQEEKKKEKEEPLMPYEIGERKLTKEDRRYIKKYFADDENDCLFCVTASPAEVEDYIYDMFGCHLTQEEIEEFQVDMQNIWVKRYGAGK